MSIDFPASPTNGQSFTSGTTTWIFDGTKWTAASAGGTGGITQLVGDVTAGPGSGTQMATLANSARPVNFIFTAEQAMTNAEELARLIPPACTFPSGGAGSSGTAGTAATASTTLTAKKNGTAFATFVWAAAGTGATVTLASATSFNGTSDVLSLDGPATADATLAKLGINLAGTRA